MGKNLFLLDHYGPGYRVWLEACDGSTGSCTKEQRSIIKDWRDAVDKKWKMAYPVHRNFKHCAYDVPPEVSRQNNEVELSELHQKDIYKIKEVKSFLAWGRTRIHLWVFGRCDHPFYREENMWLVMGRNEERWMVPAVEPTTRCAGKG